MNIIIPIITAIIVAVFAPIITVKLSTKQFYSTRWWEKKAEAYSAIIEQLSIVQYVLGKLFDIYTQNMELKEEKEKLLEEYREARAVLKKTTYKGNYIISQDSISALENMFREFEKSRSGQAVSGMVDEDYGAVKECLTHVRKCAQEELRGKESIWGDLKRRMRNCF